MSQLIELSEYVKEVFRSPEKETFFYGYYNTHQVNSSGDKVLAQKASFEGRMPTEEDQSEIGFFDLKDGSWNPIGVSRAFNWQQGSHLQWLGPDLDHHVVYNDRDTGKFVTRIYSLKSGQTQTIGFPSYAMHPSGLYSISLDYSRAFWTRAYSYAGVQDTLLDRDITDRDGLFKVDFQTGEVTQIFSLKNWLKSTGTQIRDGVRHWMEHPMFSPDGRFVFAYYRYGDKDSFETTGLILNPENGEVLHRVMLDERERFSHIGWNTRDEIAMYIAPRKVISDQLINPQQASWAFRLALAFYRRFFKPFVPRNIVEQVTAISSFYRIYRFQDLKHRDIKKKELAIDGHPSFTRDAAYMLTDTYQDDQNYRHLYILHMASEKLFSLGKFYSKVNNMGWRADLHPRFSPDERYVIIDSNTSGFHQLIMLEVNWEKISEN